MSLGIERNKFPVEIVEIRAGDRLRRDEYDIVVFETEHRADTVGYALAEHIRLGRFHPERARELGVPEGPLWGRLHKGETVTLDDGRTVSPADLVGPPRPGRTVVYSGDTRPQPGGDRGGEGCGPADPRGHVRRGRSRSGPSRPGTPPRPRRRGWRSKRACDGWC